MPARVCIRRLGAYLADLGVYLGITPIRGPGDAEPLMSPLIASIQLTLLGMVRRSRSSGPDAITLIISAPSATVRVIGPMCSIDSHPDAPGAVSSLVPG